MFSSSFLGIFSNPPNGSKKKTSGKPTASEDSQNYSLPAQHTIVDIEYSFSSDSIGIDLKSCWSQYVIATSKESDGLVQHLSVFQRMVRLLSYSHLKLLGNIASDMTASTISEASKKFISDRSTNAVYSPSRRYSTDYALVSPQSVDLTLGHPTEFIIGVVNIFFQIVDSERPSLSQLLGHDDGTFSDPQLIVSTRAMLLASLQALAALAFWPHNCYLIWSRTSDFPGILLPFMATLIKQLAVLSSSRTDSQLEWGQAVDPSVDPLTQWMDRDAATVSFILSALVLSSQFISSCTKQFQSEPQSAPSADEEKFSCLKLPAQPWNSYLVARMGLPLASIGFDAPTVNGRSFDDMPLESVPSQSSLSSCATISAGSVSWVEGLCQAGALRTVLGAVETLETLLLSLYPLLETKYASPSDIPLENSAGSGGIVGQIKSILIAECELLHSALTCTLDVSNIVVARVISSLESIIKTFAVGPLARHFIAYSSKYTELGISSLLLRRGSLLLRINTALQQLMSDAGSTVSTANSRNAITIDAHSDFYVWVQQYFHDQLECDSGGLSEYENVSGINESRSRREALDVPQRVWGVCCSHPMDFRMARCSTDLWPWRGSSANAAPATPVSPVAASSSSAAVNIVPKLSLGQLSDSGKEAAPSVEVFPLMGDAESEDVLLEVASDDPRTKKYRLCCSFEVRRENVPTSPVPHEDDGDRSSNQTLFVSNIIDDSAYQAVAEREVTGASGSCFAFTSLFRDLMDMLMSGPATEAGPNAVTICLNHLIKCTNSYLSREASVSGDVDTPGRRFKLPVFQFHVLNFLTSCLRKNPSLFVTACRTTLLIHLLMGKDFMSGGEEEIGQLSEESMYFDEKAVKCEDGRRNLKLWVAKATINRPSRDSDVAWATRCSSGWLLLRDKVLDFLDELVCESCKLPLPVAESEIILVSSLMKPLVLVPNSATMSAMYQCVRWLKHVFSSTLRNHHTAAKLEERTVLGRHCLCDCMEIASIQLEMVGLAKQNHINVAQISKSKLKFLWPIRSTIIEFIVFVSSSEYFTRNTDWITIFLEKSVKEPLPPPPAADAVASLVQAAAAPVSQSSQNQSAKTRLKTLEALLLDPRSRAAAIKLLLRLLSVFAVEMTMSLQVGDSRMIGKATARDDKIMLKSNYNMDVIDRIINMVAFCIYFPQSLDSYNCALLCLRALTWMLRAKRNLVFRGTLQNIFIKSPDYMHGILNAMVGLQRKNDIKTAVQNSPDNWVLIGILRQSLSLLTAIMAGNETAKVLFSKLVVVGSPSKSVSEPNSSGSNSSSSSSASKSSTLSKSSSSASLQSAAAPPVTAATAEQGRRKRLATAFSFDIITSLLLEVETTISLETIIVLFDMLLEYPCVKNRNVLQQEGMILYVGLFNDDDDRPKIKNIPTMHFLFTILPHCSVDIQKFILVTFCNLVSGRASLANQAICTQSHPQVFDLVLDLFPLMSDEGQQYLLRLLQSLGRHSISVAQLKHLFRMMHVEGGQRPPYSYRILQAFQGMICEDNGPRHAFVFEGDNSGLRLPPVYTWPAKKGFSCSVWCRVESPKLSEFGTRQDMELPSPNADYRPSILSFRGHTGAGFELYLSSGSNPGKFRAVLTTYSEQGEPSKCETDSIISEDEWHFIAFSIRPPAAFRAKSEALLVVDTTSVRSAIEFPHMACSIPQPLIGASPDYFQHSGLNKTLRGQMGAIYFFQESLALSKLRSIFELGPSYLYCFESTTVDSREISVPAKATASTSPASSTNSSSVTGILDGHLSSLILLSYNPAVWNGDMFLDNTPVKNGISWQVGQNGEAFSEQGIVFDDRGVYKMHARSLQGTYRTNTQDIRMALDSLGGFKTMLPLFTQFDLPLRQSNADGTMSLSSGSADPADSLALNSGRQGNTGAVDNEFSFLVFWVVKMLLNSPSSQKRDLKSLSLIPFFLEKVSASHMTLEVVEVFVDIFRNLAWNPAIQDTLLESVLLNFRYWRRCSFPVQQRVLDYLHTLVASNVGRFSDIITIQRIIHGMQSYYCSSTSSKTEDGGGPQRSRRNSSDDIAGVDACSVPVPPVPVTPPSTPIGRIRTQSNMSASGRGSPITTPAMTSARSFSMQSAGSDQATSAVNEISSEQLWVTLSNEQLRMLRKTLFGVIYSIFYKQGPTLQEDVVAMAVYTYSSKPPVCQVEGLQFLLKLLCQPELASVTALSLLSASSQCTTLSSSLPVGNEIPLHSIVSMIGSRQRSVRLFAFLISCKILILSSRSSCVQAQDKEGGTAFDVASPGGSGWKTVPLSPASTDGADQWASVDDIHLNSSFAGSEASGRPISRRRSNVIVKQVNCSFEAVNLTVDNVTALITTIADRLTNTIKESTEGMLFGDAGLEYQVVIAALEMVLFGADETLENLVNVIHHLEGESASGKSDIQPSITIYAESETESTVKCSFQATPAHPDEDFSNLAVSVSSDAVICIPMVVPTLLMLAADSMVSLESRFKVLIWLKGALSTSDHNCDQVMRIVTWQDGLLQLLASENIRNRALREVVYEASDSRSAAIEKSAAVIDTCIRVMCDLHAAAIRIGRPVGAPQIVNSRSPVPQFPPSDFVRKMSKGDRLLGTSMLRDSIILLRVQGQAHGDFNPTKLTLILLQQCHAVLCKVQQKLVSSRTSGVAGEALKMQHEKLIHLEFYVFCSLMIDFLVNLPSPQRQRVDTSDSDVGLDVSSNTPGVASPVRKVKSNSEEVIRDSRSKCTLLDKSLCSGVDSLLHNMFEMLNRYVDPGRFQDWMFEEKCYSIDSAALAPTSVTIFTHGGSMVLRKSGADSEVITLGSTTLASQSQSVTSPLKRSLVKPRAPTTYSTGGICWLSIRALCTVINLPTFIPYSLQLSDAAVGASSEQMPPGSRSPDSSSKGRGLNVVSVLSRLRAIFDSCEARDAEFLPSEGIHVGVQLISRLSKHSDLLLTSAADLSSVELYSHIQNLVTVCTQMFKLGVEVILKHKEAVIEIFDVPTVPVAPSTPTSSSISAPSTVRRQSLLTSAAMASSRALMRVNNLGPSLSGAHGGNNSSFSPTVDTNTDATITSTAANPNDGDSSVHSSQSNDSSPLVRKVHRSDTFCDDALQLSIEAFESTLNPSNFSSSQQASSPIYKAHTTVEDGPSMSTFLSALSAAVDKGITVVMESMFPASSTHISFDLSALPTTNAGVTISAPLSAWNRICETVIDRESESFVDILENKFAGLKLSRQGLAILKTLDEFKANGERAVAATVNAIALVTNKVQESCRSKLEERVRQEDSAKRRLAARWNVVIYELANERGPWGSGVGSDGRKAQSVYWMLDPHETYHRQHPKIKRNAYGTRHSIASRITRGARLSDVSRDSAADDSSTQDATTIESGSDKENIWKGLMKYNTAGVEDEGSDNEDEDVSVPSDSKSLRSWEALTAFDNAEHIIFRENVEIITFASNSTGGRTKGVLEMCRNRITFTKSNDNTDPPEIATYGALNPEFVWVCNAFNSSTWSTQDVSAMYQRHYLLQFTAIELFFSNRTSVLVNMFQRNVAKDFYKRLRNQVRPPHLFTMPHRLPEKAVKTALLTGSNALLTQAWVNRKVSNFEYLMSLNTIAGRTFNDLGQYPVFPWIVADYESDHLDLQDPKSFRDLRWPMGALTDAQREFCMQRYHEANEMHECNPQDSFPPFHHGTHYSCMGFIFWYLVRMEPFTSLHVWLQDGKFDHPDRLFNSVGSTWSGSTSNHNDVKELIPEFFYFPEFLENVNDLDLGVSQNGVKLGPVQLPPWAKGSAHEFVRLHREALESEYVSAHLHHWIDLIFGYKQRPPMFNGNQASVDACNVYFHLTYADAVNLEALKKNDKALYERTVRQIDNYGQTPSILFHQPHPSRLPVTKVRALIWPIASIVQGVDSVARQDEYLKPELPKRIVCFKEEKISVSPILMICEIRSSKKLITVDSSRILGVHMFTVKPPDVVPPFVFKVDSGSLRVSMGQNSSANWMTSFGTKKMKEYFVGVPFSALGLSLSSKMSGGVTDAYKSSPIGFEENKKVFMDKEAKRERTGVCASIGAAAPGPISATKGASSGGSSKSPPKEESSRKQAAAAVPVDPKSGDVLRVNRRRVDEHLSPHLFGLIPDARMLFSCGHWDHSFKVTQVETGRLVQSVMTHSEVVTCLALSADNDKHWLVTGSKDCTVMVWEVFPEKSTPVSSIPTHVLYGHDDTVTCLAVSADLDVVVSGSDDGTVILSSLRDGQYIRTIVLEDSTSAPEVSTVGQASVQKSQSSLMSVPVQGAVATSKISVHMVCVSRESYVLIYATDTKRHMLYTYTTNGRFLQKVDLQERLLSMILSEDGKVLLTGGELCLVVMRWVHNLELACDGPRAGQEAVLDGKEGEQPPFLSPIRSLYLTQNEKHLIVGLESGEMRILAQDSEYLRKRLVLNLEDIGLITPSTMGKEEVVGLM